MNEHKTSVSYATAWYDGLAHAIVRLQMMGEAYARASRRSAAGPHMQQLRVEFQSRSRWYYDAARDLHHGGGYTLGGP